MVETHAQEQAREKLQALYRAGEDWPLEALELMETGLQYLDGAACLTDFLDDLRRLLELPGAASTTDILDHIEARLVEKEGA